MDKPKKLILDYSKWRCGEDGPNKLGTGKTGLKNPDGYYCCLGLFSLQLGADDGELLGKGEPNEMETLIPLFAEIGDFSKISTDLTCRLIGVNDDPDTTPEEKIEYIKENLLEEGIGLEVINKP